MDLKQQNVNDPESCLEQFRRDRRHFLLRYLTIEEIWIHQYTPELNRQSDVWTETRDPRP